MHYITKQIETETGHRLNNYDGKCSHLHGHRYQWAVTVSSPVLDDTGFVMDFSDLKAILKKTIDQLDHALVLSVDDPIVIRFGEAKTRDLFLATNGERARLFLVHFNPTVENLVNFIAESIVVLLKKPIRLESIKVYETSDSFAEWHNDKIEGLSI